MAKTRSNRAIVKEFIDELKAESKSGAVHIITSRLNKAVHPEITASYNRGTGLVELKSPLLPVHEILPQESLRWRKKKRVFVEGRGIYQSFYNPIKSGDKFIVAWHREPWVKRLPISFVLRDPLPLIHNVVRQALKKSGHLRPYERIRGYGEAGARFPDDYEYIE